MHSAEVLERPSYLPTDGPIQLSDEILVFAQGRLLADAAALTPPRPGEHLPGPRARIESLAKALAHDPEARRLPGYEADMRAIKARFEDFVDLMQFDILGLGPLAPLLSDPEVTEILVNSPDSVFYERRNVRQSGRRFLDHRQLTAVLGRILERAGSSLHEVGAVGEVRLPDGGQIQVALPPVAPEGPSFSIRRIPRRPPTLAALVTAGALTPHVAAFLAACVRARVNIACSPIASWSDSAPDPR